MQGAIEATIQAYDRLDIVFANAGINGVWAPIEELQPEEWDKTLDINLRGTYLTVHYAIPYLRKAGEGCILITSSVNGNRTFSSVGASAYSTSKAGQIAFMKMAALELGRYNIRVNAVCPGAIHTNIDQRTEKRDTEEIEIKIEMPEGSPALHQGQGEPDRRSRHLPFSCQRSVPTRIRRGNLCRWRCVLAAVKPAWSRSQRK